MVDASEVLQLLDLEQALGLYGSFPEQGGFQNVILLYGTPKTVPLIFENHFWLQSPEANRSFTSSLC